MSKYGRVINELSDPTRKNIYALFVEYFGDLVMTKIKTSGTFSVYAARTMGIGFLDFRYVIAIVLGNQETPIGYASPLSSLQWNSIQTRISREDYKLKQQYYEPRKFAALDKRITRKAFDEKNGTSVYDVEDWNTLSVTLLPKKNAVWQDHGTLVSAIESYYTVIAFE